MTTASPPAIQRGSIFPRSRLAAGEVLLWEGRPSSIVYFFQPLVLFLLAIVFGFILLLTFDSVAGLSAGWMEWVVLAILLLAMPVATLRLGLLAMIVGLAVIVGAATGVFNNGLFAFLPAIVGLFAFLYDYLVWTHTAFAITDRRIMTQYGVFNIRFADTRHERISNVTVHQKLFERILGFGDVMFSTSGETGGIDSDSPGFAQDHSGAVRWDDIPKPFYVRKRAEEAMRQSTRPTNTVVYQTAPAPSPAVPAQPAVASISPQEAEERLVKLKEMLEKKLITEDEYERTRKEIISRM